MSIIIEHSGDGGMDDKKQIEQEEKQVVIKCPDNENIESMPDKIAEAAEGDGPVKAALLRDVTEEGREVKPKFIPIGAIKMPGFFTRNSDKIKDEDEIVEKDGNEIMEDTSRPKRHRLQFLHACPFTKFMHPHQNENHENRKSLFNFKYPKVFKSASNNDPEAALASMETLDEKHDDIEIAEMEKLNVEDQNEEKAEIPKLPLKERIRQKKFIIDDIVVVAIGALVLLAVIIGIVIGSKAGPPTERKLRLGKYMSTLTSCGPVEGILKDGVYNFYSIPYAVPPVGEKRFTYANSLNNISYCWNGTLDVHEPGNLCLQMLENGTIVGDEDCLTLDVVTPHVRYDSPLPVVVLIGANTLAGGISPAQPSALYARTKEIVFVRPNFRLGAFGFLSLDILNTEYPPLSGNYGLSDIIAALKWIQANIQHFGGDPSSVTLLGHRAGATLTAALTTVHKSYKLYSRAWLSSPSVIFPGELSNISLKSNEEFKKMSKCNDVHCLRKISATEILSSTPDIWLGNSAETLPSSDEVRSSWLVLDGDLLRVHAYESWAAQKEAKEMGKENMFRPMIFGTTQHSAHSKVLNMKHPLWRSDIVENMVNGSVIGEKNLTASVFKHFNKTYEGLVELISSVRYLCPLVSLARMRLSVPMYVVTGAGAGGGINGTGIADINADVEAILGTFDAVVPEQRRFISAMQSLFYYYVWNGKLIGSETELIAVGQDLLKHSALPACDLLIREDIVPRYAHID